MANTAVTLLLMAKTGNGWQRLPVVFGRNGKIRPQYALVDGEPVHCPQSYYTLRHFEGKRTVWTRLKDNATDALNEWERQQKIRQVKNDASEVGVKVIDEDQDRRTLLVLKKKWLAKLEARGKLRAVETMTLAIDDFLAVTGHAYPDQITEDSMLLLYAALRKRGNKDRTIYNKATSLSGWFKFMKLSVKEIIPQNPAFTEKDVEVYSRADLKALFAACKTQYAKVVFKLLLQTGLRMQEAMNLGWHNVDFHAKVIRVREHRASGATIKDRAERSVPLTDDLAATLKTWRKVRPRARLVVGTQDDKPNKKWLQSLKRTAKAAGLNCGQCEGCEGSDGKECSRWYIHKFRATYTTRLLRSGMDPRTVMEFTGHEDLATVLRYLAPAGAEESQVTVSSIKWS
ncbi:MAG: site-specific integrase [Acidobacteriaceae bacterium]